MKSTPLPSEYNEPSDPKPWERRVGFKKKEPECIENKAYLMKFMIPRSPLAARPGWRTYFLTDFHSDRSVRALIFKNTCKGREKKTVLWCTPGDRER